MMKRPNLFVGCCKTQLERTQKHQTESKSLDLIQTNLKIWTPFFFPTHP